MSLFRSEKEIIDIVLNSAQFEQKVIQRSDLCGDAKNDNSYAGLEKRITQLQNEINILKKQNVGIFEAQIDTIVDRVLECLRLNENERSEGPIMPSSQVTFKYPPAITKSGFPNNLSNEKGDTYFCFLNINDDVAEFEYCGNDFERAKANKTELEIACEISGTTVDTRKIINIESGTVSLHDNKWVVTKKAKIKFE